jgi:hypothetical protein
MTVQSKIFMILAIGHIGHDRPQYPDGSYS